MTPDLQPERAEELDTAVASCMKCGFCKASCPVFTDTETTTPRAKVRLARAVVRGELPLTDGVKHQMDRCLNCRACADECPSGVEPNKIALAMRNAIVTRDGLPALKRLIFRAGLPRPSLMALASRGIGLAQVVSLMGRQGNPMRRLLPLIRMRPDKDLPVLGKRSLFSRVPESIQSLGTQKTTVLFFPGCAINLLYPDVGLAAIRILRKLGARVLMPRGLVCCSTPVFNSGDVDGARTLARRNVALMAEADPDLIVTACGSCGLTISREWEEMLGLTEAAAVSGRVLDISQFVARYAPGNAVGLLEESQAVTYHDSCHLRRGMGVYEEPRQLLTAALGSSFVEMELADRCCGGGGAFSIYQPELSQTIADTKMRCLAESGASVVVSGCPACEMQLRDSIVHRRMPQRVAHIATIIDRALRLPE